MKYFLILTSVLASVLAFGQMNWAPINNEERFNYSSEGTELITRVIFAESTISEGQNLVFDLNRVVALCDTCASFLEEYIEEVQMDLEEGVFYHTDAGQFLGKKIFKTGEEEWEFHDSGLMFTIKPMNGLGAQWSANASTSLTAEIVAIDEGIVLNEPDSLKTILFSDGREMVLSKNHGIVSFFDGQQLIVLMGIEGRDLGELLPGNKEFFSFQQGDVLEYVSQSNISSGPFPDSASSSESIIKRTINSAVTTSTNAYYSGVVENFQTVHNWVTNTTTTTLTSDSFSWIFNLTEEKKYPGQPIYVNTGNWDTLEFYIAGIAEFEKQDGQYVFKFGRTWNWAIDETQLPVIGKPNFQSDPFPEGFVLGFPYPEFLFAYQSQGLATFSIHEGASIRSGAGYLSQFLEWSSYGSFGEPISSSNLNRFRLTGAVLSGDTIGTLTGLKEPKQQISALTVFPNPTTGMVSVKGFPTGKYDIVLADIFGKVVHRESARGELFQLDLTPFSRGLYILRAADREGNSTTMRLLKAN